MIIMVNCRGGSDMYWPEFWSAGWNGPMIKLQRRFRRCVLICGQCSLLNFEENDAVDL
jgi:hypothetical protein